MPTFCHLRCKLKMYVVTNLKANSQTTHCIVHSFAKQAYIQNIGMNDTNIEKAHKNNNNFFCCITICTITTWFVTVIIIYSINISGFKMEICVQP